MTAVRDVTPTQHFTEPPPRFTEATLIKALEEHGIGRPSTYAATISTIIDRGYVRVEERRLHPEPVAEIVTDFLVEHFGDYVDVEFTARMEEELDEVANGERALGARCCAPSTARCGTASTRSARNSSAGTSRPRRPTRSAREGHPMVIRLGRNGRFLACSLYPEHKETRPVPGDEPPPAGGHRRGLPGVRPGHAREQDGAVRAVRRLLALSGVQVHQEGRPAAARSAPVRGRLPQEQGRPSRPASRAADRERLLGVLELPEAATSRRTTSRSAGSTTPTTVRWPARTRRRMCLRLRFDQRHGRRATSCRARSTRAVRPTRRPWRGRRVRAAADGPAALRRPVVARAVAPVAAAPRRGDRARSSRPPTRERGLGRDRDRPGPRAVPPFARRARRLPTHPAGLPHGRRRPTSPGSRTRGVDWRRPDPGGPAGLSRRAG